MLSYEWRELEALCERVTNLRERYNRARRSKHMGLVNALKEEMDLAQRQRESLVQHISARLGTAAAGGPEDDSPVARARRQRLAKLGEQPPSETASGGVASVEDGGA